MKNIAKLSVIALTVLSLSSCHFSDTAKHPGDSVSTTVKIDSTVKTTVDSTKVDTVKQDIIKK